jgi:O-acetylserine/cysteine efflux transporter
MVGSQLAFTYGIASTGAGLASLLSNTMPVCSALLAWVVVSERPTRVAAVGIVVAIGGVAMAASVAGGGRSSHPFGVLMMMVAVATWAASNVSLKRWRPVGGELAFATWMLIVGSFVLTPVAGLGESFAVHWSWKFVGEALVAGGLGQIGFLFILLVLRRGSVMRASSVSFMVPVFAVVAGAVFLNEPVRALELGGGALIFSGVGLVVFRGSRPRAEPGAEPGAEPRAEPR